jgi:hypothetical protein
MGQIEKSLPVKLIASIFTQKDHLFEIAEKILEKKFGPVDLRSPILYFTQTRYYEEEFGSNLKRRFISFERLIGPDSLWKIKLITNKIEDKFAKDKKRQFNLDPGYISQSNLVLASTKNYSHRLYIKKDIYEEITLIYRDKTFHALPWTYPDYQSKECIDIFIKIRENLKLQLKSHARLS